MLAVNAMAGSTMLAAWIAITDTNTEFWIFTMVLFCDIEGNKGGKDLGPFRVVAVKYLCDNLIYLIEFDQALVD